jgi:hypothetical protein
LFLPAGIVARMTFGRTERLLGITIGERALVVAEVPAVSGAGAVRTAEFAYPADLTLENDWELGRELGNFLARRRFSARQVILGVPAKWLISTPYTMPPADEKTAADVLWVHATDRISPELGPMVCDFSGVPSLARPATLLLVGLQRQWMDRALAMAKAARLKVAAITPCAAVLSAVTAEHENHSLILSVQHETAELAAQEDGQLRSLRHIGSAKNLAPLAAELRRTGANENSTLVIWDDHNSEPTALDAICGSAGFKPVHAKPQWLDLAPPDLVDGNKYFSAIALAQSQRADARPSIDFLHSRLKPPKVESASNPRRWLIGAAAGTLLVCLGVYADLASLEGQISSNEQAVSSIGPALTDARRFVTSTEFAEGFQVKRPIYLACLRDLTLAVPTDGQTNFTDFNLQGNMHGQVMGRSNSEQNVLSLTDALSAAGRFADVNCRFDAHRAPAGGGQPPPSADDAVPAAAQGPPASADPGAAKAKPPANQVSFTVTFTYVPSP